MKLNIGAGVAALLAAFLALPGSSVFAQGLPPPVLVSNSASASSWLAGAQAGYNWQRNSLVYGFEADISGTHLSSTMNAALPAALPAFANTTADIDWYGTVRGRLGWASGPFMFYGTGGLAYGNVSLNSSVSMPAFPLFVGGQTSSVKAGWVLGAGFEYLWTPNLSLSVGYQYIDLGSVSLAGTTTVGLVGLTESVSTHAQFQLVSAGLSWRFPPGDRGSHGPWEGLYVGGHAGGGWGDNANGVYSGPSLIPVSDVRLKQDITLVARRGDGLGLYRYRYLWSNTVYVGVLAQEVALIHPDAVVRGALDDYLRVNYSRLGTHLMTLSEWEASKASGL